MTIVVDSQNFDSSKANALDELLNKYIGGVGNLNFEIVDRSLGYCVPLYSRSKKVNIDPSLVSALEAIDGIEVKVNGKLIERKEKEVEETFEEEYATD